MYSSASGRVEIYSGKDSALLSVLALGSAGDQVGRALATVGDLDGDGYDELLVGAPFNDGVAPDAGAAYVYSSKTGQLLASFAGAAVDDEFGFSVAAVPDMDGDGVMELFVGAPKADGLFGTDSGRGFVYSGSDYQLLLTLEGPQAGARAGTCVDALGDMDGDGVIDLVMGAPLYDLTPALGDKSGAVFCFSGVDGALVRSFLGTEPSSSFGVALAATEDLTGDGLVDLAVGAPDQGQALGLLRFFDGATGAQLEEMFGDAAGDHFAASVARAGDLDGDGLPEIVAGTGSPFLSTVGYVRGYSGVNLDERVDFQAVGVGTGFGASVHAIGDLNGDGLADLLISSLLEAVGSELQAGVVRVVTSAKAPVVSSVVGLHSALAGEVVVLGTDLHANLTATIDGATFPVTFVSSTEARISLPVDLPGGYYTLEVSSDLGSALLPDGLVRYPAIKAPSTLALGDNLAIEIDNGEPGTFVLAFSGLKYASPVPFQSFGWYYGLELNGVWIVASGAFGPGSTAQSLTIGGTADPSLVGTPVYF